MVCDIKLPPTLTLCSRPTLALLPSPFPSTQLLGQQDALFRRDEAEKPQQKRKEEKPEPQAHKSLSCEGRNYFLAMASWLHRRMRDFESYCVSCHEPHLCGSALPVVCCKGEAQQGGRRRGM